MYEPIEGMIKEVM